MRRIAGFAAFVTAIILPLSVSAQAFNGGLIGTCTGNCGTLGANGVVTNSGLAGSTAYGYVTTYQGVNSNTNGVYITTPDAYNETNGSKLNYSFSAGVNTAMSFKFQFVTSDGSGFPEYAYVKLIDLTNSSSLLLFTARTNPTAGGNIIPGFNLPPTAAGVTITPSSQVTILGTTWSPLGNYSGQCWATGCGHSGWISASYTIASAGNYQLELGVTNVNDEIYHSGLAFDWNIGQGGTPVIDVPEPATVWLMVAGLTGLWAARRRRRYP